MSTTIDGLEDIVATSSEICDLDGKLGKLTYFGVDIHDLAKHSSFERRPICSGMVICQPLGNLRNSNNNS